jgi:hypothetical protein
MNGVLAALNGFYYGAYHAFNPWLVAALVACFVITIAVISTREDKS